VSCWQLLNKQNTAEKTSLSEMNADGGTGAGGSSAPELAGAKLAAPSTVVGPRESGRVNSKQEIDNSRQAALAKAREMACSMLHTKASDLHAKTREEDSSRAAQLSLKQLSEKLTPAEESELNDFLRREREMKTKKEAEALAKKGAVVSGGSGPKPLRRTLDIRMLRFAHDQVSAGELDICFTKISSDDAGAAGSLQTALTGAVKEINERSTYEDVQILNLEDLMLLECCPKMDAVCPVFDGGSASAGEKKLVDCTPTRVHVLCDRQRLKTASHFLKLRGLIHSPATPTPSTSSVRKKGRPRADKCDKCYKNRRSPSYCAKRHGGDKSKDETVSESAESDGSPPASSSVTVLKRKLKGSKDLPSAGEYVRVWSAEKKGSKQFDWWKAQVTAVGLDGVMHVRYLNTDGTYWGAKSVQFPATAWGEDIRSAEHVQDIFKDTRPHAPPRKKLKSRGKERASEASAQYILKLITCSEAESAPLDVDMSTEKTLGNWYVEYHNDRILALSDSSLSLSPNGEYKALPESFLTKYMEEQHGTPEESDEDEECADAKHDQVTLTYMAARCFVVQRLILSNVDVASLLSADGRKVKAHLPDVIDMALMQAKLGVAAIEKENHALIQLAESLQSDHPLCIRPRASRSAAVSPVKS
jgi:hypothetical protein